MSTVSRGNAFENRVFNALSNELNNNRLLLLPDSAKVFQKKGYFSRDRGSEIIVDISFEAWLPNADNWSFILVVECKDYSHPIPVNEVEEFINKLDQIAGANKKGILAITGSLQKAALSVAKSKGIAIVRLLPDNQVKHMISLMTSSPFNDGALLHTNEFYKALTIPNFVGEDRDFYAALENKIFGNWNTLLKMMIGKLSSSKY